MTRVQTNRVFIYTVLALFVLSLLHTHAFAEEATSYKLTSKMVSEQVSDRLVKMGAGEKVTTIITGYPSSVIASATSPLKVEISGLDFMAKQRTWSAHMRVSAMNDVLYDQAIQGRFSAMVSVPVLSRRMHAKEIITDLDITHIYVPESRLHRDAVTDESVLIGKSPRRVISAERPIRINDIAKPVMVEKGKMLQVHYTRGGLHIHTIAKAKEDGAIGDIITVENVKSESLIQARILSNGNAEVVDLNQYSANSY